MSIPARPSTVASTLLGLAVMLAFVGGGSMFIGLSPIDTVVGEEEREPALQNATLSGPGYIDEQHDLVQNHPGTDYVWKTGELNVSVTVAPGNSSGEFEFCARAYSEEAERINHSDCTGFQLTEDNETTVTASLPDWPENRIGNHTIILELSRIENDENEVISEKAMDVIVIQRNGDLTGDGLTNEEEVAVGTDFTVPDTSGNGLTDWEEVMVYGTDPRETDTTGDGIDDATLIRFGLDPTDPYLAHRYAAVLLLFLLTIGVGTFITVRRLRRGHAPIGALSPHRGDGGSPAAGSQGDGNLGPPIDESLLTNEECVIHLLQRNDGRMKQSQIVNHTDWSKAKVSRVLSSLEDEETIRKIQVGRENVVEFRDEGH